MEATVTATAINRSARGGSSWAMVISRATEMATEMATEIVIRPTFCVSREMCDCASSSRVAVLRSAPRQATRGASVSVRRALAAQADPRTPVERAAPVERTNRRSLLVQMNWRAAATSAGGGK
jgi:hypothetical protein